MSDHAWTEEHVVAFVAGGLTAAEAERLTDHARTCPDCAAALADARAFDRELGALFAPARPSPLLEDRVVWALRTGRPRAKLLGGWARRVAVAAGVLIVVGTFGTLASSVVVGGRLPMPGEYARLSEPGDYQRAVTIGTPKALPDKNLTNEDPGLESNLDSVGVPDAKTSDGTALRGDASGGKPGAKPGQSPSEQPPVSGPYNGVLPPSQTWGVGNEPATRFYGYQPPAGQPGTPKHNSATGMGGVMGGGGFGGGIGGFGGGGFMGVSGGGGMGNGGAPADPGMPAAENGKAPVELNKDSTPGSQPLGYFRPGDFREAALGDNTSPAKPAVGKDSAPAAVPAPAPAGARPAQQPPAPPATGAEPARRIVIRSGDIEFEVESFDSAVATVTKLVTGINGAFVATVNSEKLPNGKMKGAVTVRTPPEHLDGLVLDLRKELGKGGELKGVRIGSQDITKQYTDLESRLRAARTMEQRLLQIIKEGKGEIKQLLEAEKELGVWRTKIEEVEGELRYYGNMAALSTLTIALAEKEIRAAAGIAESERVQAGVEVEDVDRAYRQLLAAVTEAKGRVSKSEVKQLSAGQFNATLHFEAAPEAAGPLRDRLRQLGRVARLEIDRVQQPEAGAVAKDAKVHRGDTLFFVQLYNLATVAPRETAVVQVAAPDVSAAYQALRDAVARTPGRVVTAQLNEQDRQNVTAQLDFEVPRADEGAVRAALEAAGEVLSRQVARAPEGDNVTDTKVLYRATLLAAGKLKPREVTALAVEVHDVDHAAAVFGAQVAEAKGRPVDAQTTRERAGKVTAKVVYEVPLAAADGLVERFKGAGVVRAQQTTRDPNATDGKFATARLDVTLTNAEGIVPADDGLWPPVRRGLSYSASVLLTSLTWVVFGLCVVLPWVVVGYAGYRAARWFTRGNPTSPAQPTAEAGGSAAAGP